MLHYLIQCWGRIQIIHVVHSCGWLDKNSLEWWIHYKWRVYHLSFSAKPEGFWCYLKLVVDRVIFEKRCAILQHQKVPPVPQSPPPVCAKGVDSVASLAAGVGKPNFLGASGSFWVMGTIILTRLFKSYISGRTTFKDMFFISDGPKSGNVKLNQFLYVELFI